MLADHSSKGQRYFSTLSAPLQCSKMCLLQPAGIAGRRLISTACSCVSPLCGLTSSTIAWSQLQGTDSQHPDQRCFMQTLPCKSSFFLDIGTESSSSVHTHQVPLILRLVGLTTDPHWIGTSKFHGVLQLPHKVT